MVSTTLPKTLEVNLDLKFAQIPNSVLSLLSRTFPAARSLFEWLLIRWKANHPQEFQLDEFQNWSAQARGRAYSDRHFWRAIAQLKAIGLVDVIIRSGRWMRVIARSPIGTEMSKSWTEMSKNRTEMSKKQPSNPHGSVPLLHIEHIKQTTTPTHHPVVVGVNLEEKEANTGKQVSDSQGQISGESSGQSPEVFQEDRSSAAPSLTKIQQIAAKLKQFAGIQAVIPGSDQPAPEPSDQVSDQPAPESSDHLAEIESLGIVLHPKLKTLVLSQSLEVIQNAIAVVKEHKAKSPVKNPSGLLVKAINEGWKPTQVTSTPKAPPTGFTDAYSRLCEAGIVEPLDWKLLPVHGSSIQVRWLTPNSALPYESIPWEKAIAKLEGLTNT